MPLAYFSNESIRQITATMPSFSNNGPVTVSAVEPSTHASTALEPLDKTSQDGPALPSGFPATLAHQLAWTGSDFPDESLFVLKLTQGDEDELDAALVYFKGELYTLLDTALVLL